MAEVEGWQVDAVREALQRASDIGETRSRAALQAECGIGAGDMQGVLDTLRQAGELTETAPGEYETLTEDLRAEREAARARPEPERAPTDGRPAPLAEAARRARAGRDDVVRVQLDAAVASVMDADGLGKLVEAGIVKAAEAQVGFVFEVTP